MNVEAVRAHQHVARLQVVANLGLVDVGLQFIRQQDVDDVGLLGRFGGGDGLETVALREVVVLAAGTLADDDLHAAVAEVLSMGVALRTVTNDGDRLPFECGEIGVFVVVNLCGHEGSCYVTGASPLAATLRERD